MRMGLTTAIVAGLIASASSAQAPQAPRAAPPLSPVKGLPLASAMEAVRVAIATCASAGQKVGVTLIDHAGNVKVSAVGDEAAVATIEVAKRKALTSLTFQMDGVPLTERIASDKDIADRVAANPDTMFIRPRGARLILVDGHVVGVLAVSGAMRRSADDVMDDDCAKAGLAAITR